MFQYHPLPGDATGLAAANDHSVLLETSRFDRANFRSFLFLHPHALLRADNAADIPDILSNLERCNKAGMYVAGYLAYECGHAFEPAAGPVTGPSPLAWFGVYKAPYIFDHRTGTWDTPLPEYLFDAATGQVEDSVRDITFSLSESEYASHIESVLGHIHEGDTYQINFSMRCRFKTDAHPIVLYSRLKREQPVSYGAFISTGDDSAIVSLSPELFFKTEGNTITAKPMKGTAPRGKTTLEDRGIAHWLEEDEKNRAENLMIVDLLRNDIGRIAKTGTVAVPHMFVVESYPTVFQMTSTVTADLREGAGIAEILASLFPCGSITGAPKIRSMKIIAEEEISPRGVYTGAIGFAGPDREAQFNVAIRTIELRNGKGIMGVGGGIVADSTPSAEYTECLLKANFLTNETPEFELIESMRWEEGFPLLKYHLLRLKDSAEYFDFVFDEALIQRELERIGRGHNPGIAYKVRLTLSRDGNVSLESSPLEADVEKLTVGISKDIVDSRDRFLYHKTTNRKMYESGITEAQKAGHVDMLYFNERGELTEGAISNVILETGGKRFTPPMECGVLAGVYRRHLIETTAVISEKVLRLEDLRQAGRVFICNAVRGLREVKVIGL